MSVNTYALLVDILNRQSVRTDLPINPGFQTFYAIMLPAMPVGALHNSDHLSLSSDQWAKHTFVRVGPQGLHGPGERATHSEVPKPNSAMQGSFAF
jgi:hypothetical protein